MIKQIFLLTSLLTIHDSLASCTIDTPEKNIAECKYERFTVWISCQKKAALMSWSLIGPDSGSVDTSSRSYFLDESAEALSCQQTTEKTYAKTHPGFDVGHLTAIDFFDDDKAHALQTNVMTNMIPQAQSFNRTGAWKRSESIVECYRDEPTLSPLLVISGTIFGSDISNDHFSISHGLPQTPDHLWKLVYSASSNQYDAWIMANTNASKAGTFAESRRSIESLISVLEGQSDSDYAAIIARLRNIQSKDPDQLELGWNSKCNARRG